MNNKIIWISIAVIVLIVILYFVYKYYNKTESTVSIVSPKSVGNVNALDGLVISRTNGNSTVFNAYPQEYLNQYPNPELIRVK